VRIGLLGLAQAFVGCTAARIEARRRMCLRDWQHGRRELWAVR